MRKWGLSYIQGQDNYMFITSDILFEWRQHVVFHREFWGGLSYSKGHPVFGSIWYFLLPKELRKRLCLFSLNVTHFSL